MKLGFYLETSKFLSREWSYTELVNFLDYLQKKYYPYKPIEEIFDMIFKLGNDEDDDIPEEYKHFYFLDIETLESLREEYSRAGEWELAEIAAKVLEKRKPKKHKSNLEKHVFLVHAYLSRISNITLEEVLQLDIDVVKELLNDKELKKYAENRLT